MRSREWVGLEWVQSHSSQALQEEHMHSGHGRVRLRGIWEGVQAGLCRRRKRERKVRGRRARMFGDSDMVLLVIWMSPNDKAEKGLQRVCLHSIRRNEHENKKSDSQA